MRRRPPAPRLPCVARAIGCAIVLLALTGPLAGQRPDSVVSLDPLVVTADRSGTPLASSIASVSVLSAQQLARMPRLTLAEALRQVPGFALVDMDGLGRDPQVMVRGFYGGGEAEYVIVMVDGRPVNDVQAGLVAWDAIPLAAVDRIEIVRGGASALWGDAAIGGVVNVITRAPGSGGERWSMAGGSHGSWRGSLSADARVLGRDLALSGGIDRTDGYREHAERTTGRVRATWLLASDESGSLRLDAAAHRREFDEPGPVPASRIDADRRGSDVFYRFDQGTDRRYGIGLDTDRSVGSRARLSGSLSGELRSGESVRTIVLAPGFADTKERVLETWRGGAGAQLSIEGTGLPVRDRMVAGMEATHATLDAKYYAVLAGDASAYGESAGGRGELDTSGRGGRTAAAAFAQYTLLPVAAVRLSLGGRADWLRDSFDVLAPEEPARLDATHFAFSPRVGLNVEYLGEDAFAGNAWVSAGRSFKAPTLDQLFDRRRLPVPFPPFATTISNALLEPQHGTSIEAGVYQRAAAGSFTILSSLSVYGMEMEDELDFDVPTLRYVNIGRSRHQGVEAGVTVNGPGSAAAFLNYTRQDAVARSGENAGRRLKAIPRHFTTAGVSVSPAGGLEAALMLSHARGIFLDDANTMTLPPYTHIDARLGHAIGGVRLTLDVRNVFDARYSTTGFPDPAGSAELYYRPAAGRTFELGARGGF